VQLIIPLALNLAVVVGVSLVGSGLVLSSKRRSSHLLWGLTFGLGAILSMATALNTFPGWVLDHRNVILALAGYTGSLGTATLATLLASAYRIGRGGEAVWLGVLLIVLFTASGFLLRKQKYVAHPLNNGQLLLFGLYLGVLKLGLIAASQRWLADAGAVLRAADYAFVTLTPLGVLIVFKAFFALTKQVLQVATIESALSALPTSILVREGNGAWYSLNTGEKGDADVINAANELEARPWGLVSRREGTVTTNEAASDFHWMMMDTPSFKGSNIKLLALDDIGTITQTSRELELFFEMSHDGMLMLRADGEIVRANQAFMHLFEAEEIFVGRSLWDFLDPLSKVFGRSDLLRLCEAGGSSNVVVEVCSQNFPKRSLEASFIVDIAQKLVYATLRDITAQKLDEANQLAQNTLLLEHAELIDAVHDAIVAYNHLGQVTYWNRGAEGVYGWGMGEVFGAKRHEIFGHGTSVPQDYPTCLAEKGYWRGELTRTRRDGSDIVVLCNVATLYEGDNLGPVILEVSRDVTAWREMMLTENKLAALVMQSSNAIVSTSLVGEILSWNDATTAILGHKASDALGRLFGDLLLGGDIGWSLLLCGSTSLGHFTAVDVPLKRSDGTLLQTLLTVSPLRQNEDAVSGWVFVIRDLSQEEASAKEFVRLDRLNYLGQLVQGIAHELRNPLTTARGFVQLFAARPELAAYTARFDLLLSEIDRMNDLLGDVTTLSSTRHVELEYKLLQDVVMSLRESLAQEAALEGKALSFELTDYLPLSLNLKEVRALIVNLVRNALEASFPGGLVTIRTEQQEEGVLLSVEDRGIGIDAKNKAHIGDPFFTTKAGGTGMGLAYCYAIARLHQASISFTSEGGTTTFQVLFPLTAEGKN